MLLIFSPGHNSLESALKVLKVLIPLTVLNFLRFSDSCVFILELECWFWPELNLELSFFNTVFLQIKTTKVSIPWKTKFEFGNFLIFIITVNKLRMSKASLASKDFPTPTLWAMAADITSSIHGMPARMKIFIWRCMLFFIKDHYSLIWTKIVNFDTNT